MPRRPVLVTLSLVVLFFVAGCGLLPVVSETGLLPGPPTTLLVQSLPPETVGSLLSQYGEIGTHPCPSGQIWIGMLNISGEILTLNSCVSTALATSYAQSIGAL